MEDKIIENELFKEIIFYGTHDVLDKKNLTKKKPVKKEILKCLKCSNKDLILLYNTSFIKLYKCKNCNSEFIKKIK